MSKTEEQMQLELSKAVDTAIVEATPESAREAAVDTPPEPASDDASIPGEESPGDSSADAVGDRDKGDGAGHPVGDEGAGPAADGEAGKKAAPAAETPPAPAAAAPGAQAAKPVPAKPDHVNDPIPDTVKGRTRERMEFLTTSIKSVHTENAALKRDLTELYNVIEETKAPPQQFAQTMDNLRLLNSDKPADRRAAAKWFREQADAVAAEYGDPLPGKDPLEAHADLKERVEEGDITRELALELAQARGREAAAQRAEAGTRQRQEQETARQAEIGKAKEQLNVLGDKLYRADPAGYSAKTAKLVPRMQEMIKTVHPSMWASTYQTLYENLADVMRPPPGSRAPAGTGANQPMRPRVGAGAGPVQEPKSALEAMEMALRR